MQSNMLIDVMQADTPEAYILRPNVIHASPFTDVCPPPPLERPLKLPPPLLEMEGSTAHTQHFVFHSLTDLPVPPLNKLNFFF